MNGSIRVMAAVATRPFCTVPRQPDEKEAVKIFKANGEVEFSNWVKVINTGDMTERLFPKNMRYEMQRQGASGKPGRVIFKVALDPARLAHTVTAYGPGHLGAEVSVNNWKIEPGHDTPDGLVELIERELFSWLKPLAENSFRDPLVSMDKNGKVAVDFRGYHVSWIGADAAFVKKGDVGNRMQAFADKADVYFGFGSLQVCAEIRDGKVVKAARREPPAHRFNYYWVIPSNVKKEALKVHAELENVLAEVEGIRKEAGATAQA